MQLAGVCLKEKDFMPPSVFSSFFSRPQARAIEKRRRILFRVAVRAPLTPRDVLCLTRKNNVVCRNESYGKPCGHERARLRRSFDDAECTSHVFRKRKKRGDERCCPWEIGLLRYAHC